MSTPQFAALAWHVGDVVDAFRHGGRKRRTFAAVGLAWSASFLAHGAWMSRRQPTVQSFPRAAPPDVIEQRYGRWAVWEDVHPWVPRTAG